MRHEEKMSLGLHGIRAEPRSTGSPRRALRTVLQDPSSSRAGRPVGI